MRVTGKCFLLMLIYLPLGWGQPVVTQVIGEMAQDGLIEISGSGFGDQGPDVVFFDDFEGGSDGQAVKTGNGSAIIGQWNATEGNPRYSSESSISGNLAFRADMSDGYRKFAEVALPPGGVTDLFVSWWIYLPEQDNFPGEGTENGTNWKQLWVQGSSTTDDDLVLPVLVGNTVFLDGNDDCLGPAPTGSMHGTLERQWSFRKGEWLRLWALVKGRADETGQIFLHELGSNGIQTLTNRPSTQVQCGMEDRFEKVRINGYGRTTPDCHPMFDDVYVAVGENAGARIEIGNRPVYEECTKLSTAIPVNWDDGTIQARVQLGSFENGEQAYVFVFDRDYNVSNGTALGQRRGMLRKSRDEADVVVNQSFNYALDMDKSQNAHYSVDLLYSPSWVDLYNESISGNAPDSPTTDSIIVSVTGEGIEEIFTLYLKVIDPLPEFVIDNTDTVNSSSFGWSSSNHFAGYYGPDYLYSQAETDEWFEWTLNNAGVFGKYELFACWTAAEGRPDDVSFEIECDSGTFLIENVDQRVNGAKWNYLGTFCFSGAGKIRLLSGKNGSEGACADAIRFSKKAAPVKNLEPISKSFGESRGRAKKQLTMNVRGTKLDFSLPTGGGVHLNLFDMRGKFLKIINGKMYESGHHQLDLKKSLENFNLSNQIYIIHLKHKGNVLTRRIRFR